MTVMVEKIGLAIDAAAEKYIKDWHVKCRKDKTLIPYIGMADVPHEVLARAALEAMREPDDAVLLVMAEVLRSCDNESGFMSETSEYIEDAKRVHAAFIDAALKENAE